MTGQRYSPRAIKPTNSVGAVVADGTYGATVVGGVITGLSATNKGRQVSYTVPTPAVAAGTIRLYNDTGSTWTLVSVRATLAVAAPSGATTVDVNKNGTSIFATSGDQPSITGGGTTNKVTTILTTSVADGEYLTVDVDAVGSGAGTLIVTIAIQ